MPTAPPLLRRHKLAYGVGQLAEGLKNGAFETFLLFYYNQVLGLPGTLSGAALMIALIFDAVTDPLAGSLSDATRSRWGRRHPWMVAAALPRGRAMFARFSPPAGLGTWGLFAWLTVGAVAVRGAMTLYHVPHNSLGAELSEDYAERTRVVGYRVVFSVVGLGLAPALGFFVFLREGSQGAGIQHPAAYTAYAATLGVLMVATVWLSAFGTWSRIPFLPRAAQHTEAFSPGRLFRELRSVLVGSSFGVLFAGVIVYFVLRGLQSSLGLHLNAHFGGLSSDQMGSLVFPMVIGFAVGTVVWSGLASRLEKRTIILAGTALFTLFVALPVLLRLAGILPETLSPATVTGIIAGGLLIAAFGAGGSVTAFNSAMADITDEHELRTGRRQEGVYFGALAFAGKSSSGIGHGIAGVGLDLIAFPTNAAVGSVAPEVVRNLGVLYGPGLAVLAVVSLACFSRYRLTRARFEALRRELEERRATQPER
jgi:GPH family glycoside/pentoside/hexuronide:cation symporter